MKYAEIDLPQVFRAWQEEHYWGGEQAGFEAHLRGLVTNPQRVTERLRWCSRCGRPHDLHLVDGAESAYCQTCWGRARPCDHCGERVFDLVNVLDGGEVCGNCVENYYVFCRNCNGAYPHGQAGQHKHGGDGCCESPALEFTIPYPGGVLAQDEQVHVSFEQGLITTTAIKQVVQCLARYAQNLDGNIYDGNSRAAKMQDLAVALNRNPELVGLETVTREGSFTTRLKRHAYKERSLKLDPPVLTSIGNLISTTTTGREFDIAFTRDLNLPPAEFGNSGSCWWTDYKESRCALKSNGGMGMRDMDGERVKGRAWVMPMKVGVDGLLTPTFDAGSGLYFAFNGYGTLTDDYHRILAEVLGIDGIANIGFEADRYYVNSSSGKLVGPPDVVGRFSNETVRMPLTTHSDLFTIEQAAHQVSAQPKVKENAHV